jgi:DNA-binding NarL/FixJ family response regulator
MVILIIDDSNIIVQRLAFLIAESGSKNISAVHTAATYADATALLRKITPDVVLMDMYLPGHRSRDLLKFIKKNNSHASLIVLVNYPDTVSKEKYECMGADFVFDKYNELENIPVTIDAIAGSMLRAS